MAVRVTDTGEDPRTISYPDATSAAVIDDHLEVSGGNTVYAIFHRNCWSRAEFTQDTDA